MVGHVSFTEILKQQINPYVGAQCQDKLTD